MHVCCYRCLFYPARCQYHSAQYNILLQLCASYSNEKTTTTSTAAASVTFVVFLCTRRGLLFKRFLFQMLTFVDEASSNSRDSPMMCTSSLKRRSTDYRDVYIHKITTLTEKRNITRFDWAIGGRLSSIEWEMFRKGFTSLPIDENIIYYQLDNCVRVCVCVCVRCKTYIARRHTLQNQY